MRTSLDPSAIRAPLQALSAANRRFAARYPGEPSARQPVHTVYGGAHLFRADTARRLGDLALAHLDRYAPDPFAFARALGLRGAEALPTGAAAAELLARLDADPAAREASPDTRLAHTVHRRTVAKLRAEPVEDFRIDFVSPWALNCGAVDLADLQATGLTREELESRSFLKIVADRRAQP